MVYSRSLRGEGLALSSRVKMASIAGVASLEGAGDAFCGACPAFMRGCPDFAPALVLLVLVAMDASNTISAAEARFRAVLLPHRVAMRKGFIVLVAIIGGVSVLTAAALRSSGMWPLASLLVLDVVLIAALSRLKDRAGRIYELVELTSHELRLTRVHPSGGAQCWAFNPYWVRLEFEDDGANRLRLRSHGRELTFGHFLTNEEKRGFAAALAAALCDARSTRI